MEVQLSTNGDFRNYTFYVLQQPSLVFDLPFTDGIRNTIQDLGGKIVSICNPDTIVVLCTQDAFNQQAIKNLPPHKIVVKLPDFVAILERIANGQSWSFGYAGNVSEFHQNAKTSGLGSVRQKKIKTATVSSSKMKPGVKPKPLDPRLVAVIFEQVRKMAEKDQPKSLRRLALRCNYEFAKQRMTPGKAFIELPKHHVRSVVMEKIPGDKKELQSLFDNISDELKQEFALDAASVEDLATLYADRRKEGKPGSMKKQEKSMNVPKRLDGNARSRDLEESDDDD